MKVQLYRYLTFVLTRIRWQDIGASNNFERLVSLDVKFFFCPLSFFIVIYMPYNANKEEKSILAFWNEKKIFEKSVSQRPEDKPYVFYDGPPFATGLPHFGHLMVGIKKDVVLRFWTMKGYRVERRWGWDCHGLPIENLVEKELKLPDKKEIEKYGIDKFNEACRSKVLMYVDEWKKIIPRTGRWVDMDNPYKTMDLSFMESVWWVFKSLFDRGLVYEGKKPMHICPRCVTPLSNFEVSQGYKDIKDLSVTAKFKITNAKEKLGLDEDVFVLAWTTTPWTLPGNILLAVGKDIVYSVVRVDGVIYIVAKELLLDIFPDKDKDKFEVIQQNKGKDLVTLTYEPLFPYFVNLPGADNSFRIVTTDFVTTNEGTGIVHLAPAFGSDDYAVFRKEDVPFIQHVRMDGTFIDEVTDFAGMNVKPSGDHTATDVEIIKWLAAHGKLFAKKKYEHSYPHCWRCDTPLLNYATNSWFVEVTKIQKELLENNQKIHWVPEHIRDGRFGKWLEGVKDWSISRNRFWGTPIPIWKSDDGDILCIGSAQELAELSGKEITDLHKHKIDDILIKKDGKTYHRISEVLDTWFDSGSVPYGRMHYPFENKVIFEKGFPADFIAESQDQTRGWFYTLHVLATALTSGDNPAIKKKETSPAFKNVSVSGMILAEDGKKMSKRLKNYPDPTEVMDKYGADALRYYLLASSVMHGESLNFSEKEVREMYNKVVNTLVNVLAFYKIIADQSKVKSQKSKVHVLDKWILARLNQFIGVVTKELNEYHIVGATRPIFDFVTDLSQWYVRRSRDRFKSDESQVVLTTFHSVLHTVSKVIAPFMPFLAELIYQALQGEMESVHLELWPKANHSLVDEKLLVDMILVRKITEMAHALRKEAGIAVRQPLARLDIGDQKLDEECTQLICDELNVKAVVLGQKIKDNDGWLQKTDSLFSVALDTNLTPELKQEGLLREVIRAINQMRKDKGLTPNNRIVVSYKTSDEQLKNVFTMFVEELKIAVLADEVNESDGEPHPINKIACLLAIKKV